MKFFNATDILYFLFYVSWSVWLGKEFLNMRQNREEWRLLRVGDAVRTVGQLRGELNAFAGLQPIFVASRQKILTGNGGIR